MRCAIIPARGGSKRIPRKNIKPFCGKPMIAWSIAAALESGCFDRVIVSTDDDEIAAVAERHGAETPFRRPQELSDDHTGTTPVVAHAISWLAEHGPAPQEVCCIYATAPFTRPEDIKSGLAALQGAQEGYAFSVTSFPAPIQRAMRIDGQGRTEMFHPEFFQCRSQDLEEAYHDAGQFYWALASTWLEDKIIFAPHSVAVVLPRHRVQDIDTPEDWLRAEYIFQILCRENNTPGS